MRITTALNHFERFASIIRDTYSAARSYQKPHAWILERLAKEVYQDPAWKKCPAWVRDKAKQVNCECLRNVQRNQIIWLHTTPKNKTPRPFNQILESKEWEETPDKEKTDLAKGHHYWLIPALPHGKTLVKQGENWVATYTVGGKF